MEKKRKPYWVIDFEYDVHWWVDSAINANDALLQYLTERYSNDEEKKRSTIQVVPVSKYYEFNIETFPKLKIEEAEVD